MFGRIEEKMGRDSNNRLKIWRASVIKKAMPRTALRRSRLIRLIMGFGR